MTDLEQAQRELNEARAALANSEHGADTTALEERYVEALRVRNTVRRRTTALALLARDPAVGVPEGAVDAEINHMRGGETMKIVTLEGSDLARFHDLIRHLDRAIDDGSFERVQLMIDNEGFKVKYGRAVWTPGLGDVREE